MRLRAVLLTSLLLCGATTTLAQQVVFRGVEGTPRLHPNSPENVSPFLLVREIRVDGRRLEPGVELSDPDWIARAEFVVENVSPYPVTGATLAFSFNGARTAIAAAFGCKGLPGCPRDSAQVGSQESAITIAPRQTVVLRGVRNPDYYKFNASFFQNNNGRVDLTLTWMGFNTANGERWLNWKIVPPPR